MHNSAARSEAAATALKSELVLPSSFAAVPPPTAVLRPLSLARSLSPLVPPFHSDPRSSAERLNDSSSREAFLLPRESGDAARGEENKRKRDE